MEFLAAVQKKVPWLLCNMQEASVLSAPVLQRQTDPHPMNEPQPMPGKSLSSSFLPCRMQEEKVGRKQTMFRRMPFRWCLFVLLACSPPVLAQAVERPRSGVCTQQYAPVCALVREDCARAAPCPEVRRTFPNACMARLAGARILSAGPCRFSPPMAEKRKGGCRGADAPPEQDPGCKAWTDGCNICRREKPGAPPACTKMACRKKGRPMCLKRF